MSRDLTPLSRRPFDLLVVGGGIHGVAAALDGSLRGLTVALVERGDIGSGSSFNHLKTLHGGLRSLQSADLRKFREATEERRNLARMAPHLVRPLGFLLPTWRTPTRSRAALRAAFAIDAALGYDRNRGLPSSLHLPTGRVVSATEARRLHPALAGLPVTGGAVWYDYQVVRTDRLTMAFAQAAREAGATLATYVEAIAPVRDGDRVVGMRVRDVFDREECDIRAGVTLNAAGASMPAFLRAFGGSGDLPLQKALNVVTARPFDGLALAAPLHGGTLFQVPWEGRLVIGTWHDEQEHPPSAGRVTDQELDRFLEDANAAFPALDLSRDEVTMVHRGLVPGVRGRDGRVAMRSKGGVHDHAADGSDGAISIVGVKYTTGRAVAAHAVDAVMRRLGRDPGACRTAERPLPGGDVADPDALVADIVGRHPGIEARTARHLALTYGSRWGSVVQDGGTDPLAALAAGFPQLRAEVRHAVRHEFAVTLTDVVARRIQLGAAGHPGDAAARAAAAVMRSELAWSDAKVEDELRALRDFYQPVVRDL